VAAKKYYFPPRHVSLPLFARDMVVVKVIELINYSTTKKDFLSRFMIIVIKYRHVHCRNTKQGDVAARKNPENATLTLRIVGGIIETMLIKKNLKNSLLKILQP
jgi:hypothetical protein